ncbi:tRNA (guanosine(46)-N7)-methyltransferase TrmB [Buchananella hordeovulneris]|nr:tRNA (guanosine(46)-N7)-methyltransferase TrmB [Buchananella hordeovulneris]RRD52623.1 tRNA (guanosine(46)-N7)-methyltransferase TrmB [Buchananella hordeovulneris]
MPDLAGRLPQRTTSFARRSGRLPQRRQRLWDAHAADLVVPVRRGPGETTVASDFRLEAAEVFGRSAPLVVEIGSGGGEALVAHAAAHPERNHLALEVWRPGVAQLLARVVAAGVSNVRVVEVDAAQALPVMLPSGSIDELWTFFPDPWRKARHHKRRLVQEPFARQVAELLVPGGVWRLATDWADYADHIAGVLAACDDVLEGGRSERFAGRVRTRFEGKGVEAGREIVDFTARRR